MSTNTEAPATPTSRLVHDIAAERIPVPADPVRRRRILLGLGAAIVVLALLAGALRLLGVIGGESDADKNRAAVAEVQKQVLPQLQELMAGRETFFAAERSYLSTMQQAEAAVRKHQAPGTEATEATELRKVAKQMAALRADLQNTSPQPQVTSEARDYLISATSLLGRDAGRNATAMTAMTGKQRPVRLTAVNDDNALVPIKRMNKSLLYVLDAAELPVTDFDLPGGKDKSKADHSTSM